MSEQEDQMQFMKDVFDKSGGNANNLAKLIGVSPRTIRDWRRCKFYIPLYALNIICEKYNIERPSNIDQLIKNWENKKLEVSRKGGLSYYRRYGVPGSIESRRRGGIAGLKKLRELGLAPKIKRFKQPKYSSELAEFVGIMLGDGHVGKEQIEISLNSISEVKYSQFVSNLCNKLFDSFTRIVKKKNCNAFSICCHGVNLIKYLTKIGLKQGNKVKQQVGVPLWIRSSNEFSKMCCRGLMDTDGCIAIHRYYVGKKRYFYKKLIFTNHSIPLAEFVYNTLARSGMHPKMFSALEKRRVWLYNSTEVQKYLNIIGTSNEKLLRFKETESGLDGKAASC